MYIVIREKRNGTEVWISLDKLAQLMGLSTRGDRVRY